MVITRRQLIAAGGVATGAVASPLLPGRGSEAAAAAPVTRDSMNVKDPVAHIPGAVGDGRTDDTAAVQGHLHLAALVGGGVVYMPPGTYLVSSTVYVPANVSLVGG